MLREITYSKDFKKDIKELRSNKAFDATLLAKQIDTIAAGESLDVGNRNHKMAKTSRAEYQGTRNFHHKADIVVIYRLTDSTMYLERIGSHSKLKLLRNKN